MKQRMAWAVLGIILFSGVARADMASVIADGSRSAKPRYLVAFKQGVSDADKSAALAQMGMAASESLEDFGAVVAEAQPGKARVGVAAAGVAAALKADPNVAWVEEDKVWPHMFADMPVAFSQVPFPAFNQVMAGLQKVEMPAQTEGELPWGIRRVNAPAAWEQTQGQGVRVAVIDTGIDYTHPDLAANYAGGYNAVDPKKPPLDDNGHGSHVAGTIAAVKDGKGVVGVAPKARLYAVKVLDAEGNGSLSAIVKGLIWCGNHHMQVANMSLGAPQNMVFMRWAVAYASLRGVTVVAAAGNEGGPVSYPGAYPEVITVTAADSRDKIAEWSSRGKEVDFIAPGVDVQSDAPGGGLQTMSGTSMATPHVAGLAALAVSQGAGSPAQVRKALSAAATKLDGLSWDEQGYGMIDAGKLLRKK